MHSCLPLQLLAFVDALLCCEDSGVKRVLILTPINTLYNWRSEFERWIPRNYDYGVRRLGSGRVVLRCLITLILTRYSIWYIVPYGSVVFPLDELRVKCTRMHTHTHTHTHTGVPDECDRPCQQSKETQDVVSLWRDHVHWL